MAFLSFSSLNSSSLSFSSLFLPYIHFLNIKPWIVNHLTPSYIFFIYPKRYFLSHSHIPQFPFISFPDHHTIINKNTLPLYKPLASGIFAWLWKIIKRYFKLFFRIFTLTLKFSPVILILPWSIFFSSLRPLLYRQIVNSLESSGVTFIKLGQWASTRYDIFPEEFCNTLSKLHYQAPVHPFQYTKELFKKNFHFPISEIFDDLQEDPIGSGCIAQIYKARLKDTNQFVALKVMHPDIRPQVQTDLDILSHIADFFNLFPSRVWINPIEIFQEFSFILSQQLDLSQEAKNLIQFRINFKDNPYVDFPKPIYPYVSNDFLVESYHDGRSIFEYMVQPTHGSLESSETTQYNKHLAEVCLKMLLEMIIVHNFVHGDLHPGNILVIEPSEHLDNKSLFSRKQKSEPSIVCVDAGIICSLDQIRVENFKDLFFAILNDDDVDQAGKLLVVRRPKTEEGIDSEPIDEEQYISEISEMIRETKKRGLKHINFGLILFKLCTLSCQHHVKLDSKFVSLVISLAIMEGVGRRLHPDINILSVQNFLAMKNVALLNEIITSRWKETTSQISYQAQIIPIFLNTFFR